jgi:hypothetical protein
MRIPSPRRALRRRRVRGRKHPGFPVPFVVGAPRSGTTLLRLMLDAHPEVAIPGETHFIHDVIRMFRRGRPSAAAVADHLVAHHRWGDFHLDEDELRRRIAAVRPLTAADAIRAFYRLYADKQGKPRWGDKTPGYVKNMRPIANALPEAHFIHLLRDGRDVALSVIPLNWGPDNVERAAEVWRERVRRARAQRSRLPYYMEVRYEDLLVDTEGALRAVCDFIDLHFDPSMLAYHERAGERLREKERDLVRPSRTVQPAASRMASHALAKRPPQPDRVARWRKEMSPEDLAVYERIAGDLLVDCGYELSAGTASSTGILPRQ